MTHCNFEYHTPACLAISIRTTKEFLARAERSFDHYMEAAREARETMLRERQRLSQQETEFEAAVRREGTPNGK